MSVYEVIRRLPDIAQVHRRCRAMAMLDAIMSPEWLSRCYSFDSAWSLEEDLASMRDGAGNEYSIVFSAAGAWARGFAHESPMSPYRVTPVRLWPGLVDGVPEPFRPMTEEPSFSELDGTLLATVCFWREPADASWSCGPVEPPDGQDEDADGARLLFDVLVDGRPEAYRDFAERHHRVTLELDAVQHVYRLAPLTAAVVAALNPALGLADVDDDMRAIGYPVASMTS
jgi:hypothetical protein